jgi:hypothetical protein
MTVLTGALSDSESEDSSELESSELEYDSATKTEATGMMIGASAKATRRAEGFVARFEGWGAGREMVIGIEEGATGCEVLMRRSRDGCESRWKRRLRFLSFISECMSQSIVGMVMLSLEEEAEEEEEA